MDYKLAFRLIGLLALCAILLNVATCTRTERSFRERDRLIKENNVLQNDIARLNGKIEMLDVDLLNYSAKIDSLKQIPAKIVTVYKHQIKTVQAFSHQQTADYVAQRVNDDCNVDMAAETTIYEGDTVTMFRLPEMKCISVTFIERDQWQDLAGVYEDLNIQYEGTIDVLTDKIELKDSVISLTEKQRDNILSHYEYEYRKNQRSERRAKTWRGVAIVSGVINVLLLVF